MTDLHTDSKPRRGVTPQGSGELQRRKELRNGRRTFRAWPLLPIPAVPSGVGLHGGPSVDWPQGEAIDGRDAWQDRPDERDLGQDFAPAPEAFAWGETVDHLQAATRSRALKICLLASVALHLGCAAFMISMPAPETVEIAGGGAVSVMMVGEQAFDSLAVGKAEGEELAQPVEEMKVAETAEQPAEATTTQEATDPVAVETTATEPLPPAAPVERAPQSEPAPQAVTKTQDAALAESVAAPQNLALDSRAVSETGELAQGASAEPLLQKQVETAETPPVEPIKPSEPIKPFEKSEKRPAEKKVTTPKKVEKPKAEEKKAAARKQAETDREAKRAPAKSRKGESGEANANAQRGASATSNSQARAEPGNAAASNYPGKVAAKLRRALKYPKSAMSSSRGEAQVAFTVLSDGSASGVRIVSSSGSPVLDQATLDAVRRAAPFPPIPAEAGRGQWTFTVPILFKR